MAINYRPANVYGNRVIAGMNYGGYGGQPVAINAGYVPVAPAYPLQNNLYYGPGVPVAQRWYGTNPNTSTVYAGYGVQQGGQQVRTLPPQQPARITQTAKRQVAQQQPTRITQTAKQQVAQQPNRTTDWVNAPGYGVNRTTDWVNAPGYGVNAPLPQPVQLPQNLNIDPYGMAPTLQAPQPVQLPQNLNIDTYGMAPAPQASQPVQLPQNLNIDPYGMAPAPQAPQPVQLPQNLNIDTYGMAPAPQASQPVQLPQNLNIDTYGMAPAPQAPQPVQLPQNYSNDQYDMAPIPRAEDELQRLPTANNIPTEQLTLRSRNGTAVINLDNGRQVMVKTRIQRNPQTGEDEEVIDEGAFINIPLRLIEGVIARIMGLNTDNTNDLDVGT